MDAVTQLAKSVPIERACDVLGVVRGRYYRSLTEAHAPQREVNRRPAPAWALRPEERGGVRDLLDTEFADDTPYTAYACTRRCWIVMSTSAARQRCTGSWPKRARCASGGDRAGIRNGSSRVCGRRDLIRFGAGISCATRRF